MTLYRRLGNFTSSLRAYGSVRNLVSAKDLSGIRSRATVAATMLLGGLGAWLLLRLCPHADIEIFARGAAAVAGVLMGRPVARGSEGWVLGSVDGPAVVTSACSAVDYFVLVSLLASAQFARSGKSIPVAVFSALLLAGPIAILVNGVRIAAVIEAHRWIIDRLPQNVSAFLHLLTGVAVFLPSLVILNLLLENHGRNPARTRS